MGRIPLMLLSDNVASSTGLGRITRELALRIHSDLSDTFELATYGLGGVSSQKFKWPQYIINKLDSWSTPDLPKVWKDFAAGRKGVALTIWNPSWLPWLADCEKLPNGGLKDFLRTKPLERWGYFPVDAVGPNGKLPEEVAEVIANFDRPLMYTEWAARLVDSSLAEHPKWANPKHVGSCPHLPHGTDTKMFYPRDRKEMRRTFVSTVTGGQLTPMKEDVFLVGIVGTNSARKDWDLGFQVCQELLHRGLNVGVWAHTNKVQGHWNILGLAKAYGLDGRIIPTITDLTDEQMAEAYCACDVTLGIGLGEGFGMPIFESIACGVPCVHGDYAGAAEFLPPEFKVKPIGFWAEGWYANKRPVFDVREWAFRVESAAKITATLPSELAWDNLWPRWRDWLLEGVNG